MAKFNAILMAIFAAIGGLLVFIIPMPIQPTILGKIFGFFITIIFYGIFGFVGGAIYALLYNFITKWISGIEIEE